MFKLILGVFALACVFPAPSIAAEPSPPPPSADTVAVARRVAAHDDFLPLVQMDAASKIQKVERNLGDLTPVEKSRVEAIGRAKQAEGTDRVIDVLAKLYATTFTIDQLRSMDAFLESPAGKAYSGRLMTMLPAVGEGMKGFDFNREVLSQTCAELKKGCPPNKAP